VHVQSADVMASLIRLKKEAESHSGKTIRFTFSGGSEAHLLAKEIAAAGVGVILTSPRPFPSTWESRRMYVAVFSCQDETHNLPVYLVLP
jgi:hypothetical protein